MNYVLTSSAAAQIAALLPNFDITGATIVNAGLTVTKAPLTVRAKSYSRPYGGGNPDLEIEYIGLKNNEYENLADVFSVMPKIATDAKSDSRGSYDIYFTTEGVARNYTVTHETEHCLSTRSAVRSSGRKISVIWLYRLVKLLSCPLT